MPQRFRKWMTAQLSPLHPRHDRDQQLRIVEAMLFAAYRTGEHGKAGRVFFLKGLMFSAG